jgi:hypothetical protein
MRDGSTVPLHGTLEDIMEFSWPVIAAVPGFERLLGYYNDDNDSDDDTWVTHEPIIGWRITDLDPKPITPQMEGGSNVLSDVVKYPPGQVFELEGGREWKNEEAWRRALPEMLRERRERKAAKESAA